MSNIKELIRAEIERLYGEYKSKFLQYRDSYHLGLYDGLFMAMKVFDSLPDEPVTDCHDLTEAAETKYPTRWKKYPNDGIVRSEEYFDLNAEKRDAFKAGAEWMKAQMIKEDGKCFL